MGSGCGIHIATDPSCQRCRAEDYAEAMRRPNGARDPLSAMSGLFPKDNRSAAAKAKDAAMVAAAMPHIITLGFIGLGLFLLMMLIAAVAVLATRGVEAAVFASMIAWLAAGVAAAIAAATGPTINRNRDSIITATPRLTKVGLTAGALAFALAFPILAFYGVPGLSKDNLFG
ncbi:hypothetical protein [uncultured Nocardioides sp.]|uniref:hypothetical protein n=1 Tax=uncultured Nocardioides sp. TaxID=198441 RepID=UPI0026309269|nr:hypothetical protein [uncultured Nocardioides sp.]